MNDKKDMINNELKTSIDVLSKHVDDQLGRINDRLDKMDSRWEKIDKSFRGNGKTGINGRLNHTERVQKLFMGVRGIILAAFVAHYLGLIEQLRNVVSTG